MGFWLFVEIDFLECIVFYYLISEYFYLLSVSEHIYMCIFVCIFEGLVTTVLSLLHNKPTSE